MKTVLIAALTCLVSITASAEDNVPRGFTPLAEYKEVQAKAVANKKLVVLVVKGADDACPNCVAAMDHGEKAAGSGVEKLFVRAEAINKAGGSEQPPALQERMKTKLFTTGASVTFLVFNPEMTEIVAEAGRQELQSDKDATSAFKKKVQAAKKALK